MIISENYHCHKTLTEACHNTMIISQNYHCHKTLTEACHNTMIILQNKDIKQHIAAAICL